jgi:hypothetical protein
VSVLYKNQGQIVFNKNLKIFERSKKINLSFCRRQIIIPPKVDYHSAKGGFSFAQRAIKD